MSASRGAIGQGASIESADHYFMQLAIAQADAAIAAGEVPVGAVVVRNGEPIAVGRNASIEGHDPSAHAEIVALRAASQAVGNYRLEGCTLYVTLEPCAMCAGAILHARLDRVVFGARDPKTGAAGSVVDLFGIGQLNHRTQVLGGVLADQCALPLQSFFRNRRRLEKALAQPIREDALRTDAGRFAGLPDYPWAERFVSHLPTLAGLRLHYLDEGPKDADTVFVCLHGSPTWSYAYRKMIAVWLKAGHRIVAPDLIGFGKSDKPKRSTFHHFAFHRNYLLELLEHLELRNIVLVVQDWGGILGLTLPMEAPQRYQGLVVMNTLLATGDVQLSEGFFQWRETCRKQTLGDIGRLLQQENSRMNQSEGDAYSAPFPNEGYRAALRAFPEMVPDSLNDAGAEIARRARAFLRHEWGGTTLLAVGAQDPVFGPQVMAELRSIFGNCPDLLVLPDVGRLVPEGAGVEIASAALAALAVR